MADDKPKQSKCGTCKEQWKEGLLHTVMCYDGVYRRICTDCLLHDEENRHRGAFCRICLKLYVASEPVVCIRCSLCESYPHYLCDPFSGPDFKCPPCSKLTFSFFPRNLTKLDTTRARALVVAAKKSMDNLKEATTLLEKEANEKALESVEAKNRAKEALKNLMEKKQ
ncbi:unnamed protein product [Cochlearia groenlandica]